MEEEIKNEIDELVKIGKGKKGAGQFLTGKIIYLALFLFGLELPRLILIIISGKTFF